VVNNIQTGIYLPLSLFLHCKLTHISQHGSMNLS